MVEIGQHVAVHQGAVIFGIGAVVLAILFFVAKFVVKSLISHVVAKLIEKKAVKVWREKKGDERSKSDSPGDH